MNLLQIPFVKTVGLKFDTSNRLSLPFSEMVQNHLQTIHASAQFALAETASGECLLKTFPDLAHKVVPVLRDSQIKFKKPAQKDVVAYPHIAEESIAKFSEQFAKKGRASICVNVNIKDIDGTLTTSGEFNWFVASV
jgi:acyl-coenzyme A thioesterase PaaI-like protein